MNSQSGKGGIAYLLETGYGLELPRRLQIDLARHVQRRTDAVGTELSAAQLWSIFREVYAEGKNAEDVNLTSFDSHEEHGRNTTAVTVEIHGEQSESTHEGVGPVEALIEALAAHNRHVDVLGLTQTSVQAGNDSDAVTLLEYRTADGSGWSAGVDRSVLTATLDAVIRAANSADRASTDR